MSVMFGSFYRLSHAVLDLIIAVLITCLSCDLISDFLVGTKDLIIMPWWAEPPEAYSSRFVYVCVIPSVKCVSHRSLKFKHWDKQHRKTSTFARVSII